MWGSSINKIKSVQIPNISVKFEDTQQQDLILVKTFYLFIYFLTNSENEDNSEISVMEVFYAIDNILTWNLNMTENKNFHLICLHCLHDIWCIIIERNWVIDEFYPFWKI